jgi:phosphoglycolate phosphatase
MKLYKNIILDIDGTLIDSSTSIRKAIEETIISLNLIQPTDEILKSFCESPINIGFGNYYNLSINEKQTATETYRNIYKKYLLKANLYDGVKEFCEYLQSTQRKIIYATYKRQDYAQAILEHFNLTKYSQHIYGSPIDNTFTNKSKIVSNLISELNISTMHSVLIGDTWNDGEAAKSNHIDFIAVTHGCGFKTLSDSLEYNPLLSANSMYEVTSYFRKICDD